MSPFWELAVPYFFKDEINGEKELTPDKTLLSGVNHFYTNCLTSRLVVGNRNNKPNDANAKDKTDDESDDVHPVGAIELQTAEFK